MPSRSNREGRVQGRPRRTTVGEDLKDIAARGGRLIGGYLGAARDRLRNRGNQIDEAVDREVGAGKEKFQ